MLDIFSSPSLVVTAALIAVLMAPAAEACDPSQPQTGRTSVDLVIRQELAADPNFLAKVADWHGIPPTRLIGMEPGRVMALVREYVTARERKAGATTSPAPASAASASFP